MHKDTQPIDRETLLIEANKIIREHEDTLAGIVATGVTQRNGVLVFSGDYFLDEQGLPTPKSTADRLTREIICRMAATPYPAYIDAYL